MHFYASRRTGLGFETYSVLSSYFIDEVDSAKTGTLNNKKRTAVKIANINFLIMIVLLLIRLDYHNSVSFNFRQFLPT